MLALQKCRSQTALRRGAVVLSPMNQPQASRMALEAPVQQKNAGHAQQQRCGRPTARSLPMKRTTLLIAALFFLGAFSLVISTSAERPPGQSAISERNARAQQGAAQASGARRVPETRENFDIRAG